MRARRFNGFDEPLKLDLGSTDALGVRADGVGCVGGNAVVVRLEGCFHLVERPPRVIIFVIVVGEEDFGEANLSAKDVNQLESVDKGFVDPLDVVVVGRANDGGKGRLCFREEIFYFLGGGHCVDYEETGEQGLAR